jgi:hypothetical protein
VTWGVLALAALAAYRLARLLTTDTLSEPLRDAVARRWPTVGLSPRWPTELVNCFWCVSLWTSLLAVLLAHWAGVLDSWQLVVLGWLAAASVAGLLYRLIEER